MTSRATHFAPADVQRRLAAIESLCRYSLAGVSLKKGESAKLERAEADLTQAIVALREVRECLAGSKPDQDALAIAAAGELASKNYMRAASRH